MVFQKDLVIMHTKNIQFKRCRKITLLPICIQEYIDILGALSLAAIYLLVALDSTWYFIEEKEKSHNKFRGFPVNSVWIKKALRFLWPFIMVIFCKFVMSVEKKISLYKAPLLFVLGMPLAVHSCNLLINLHW